MGLLNWLIKKQVTNHARTTCRVMVHSFSCFEGQGEYKTYAELAARCLDTRPGWERIEGMTFEHKNGFTLEIDDDWSLAHVTMEVVAIEVGEMVGNLPSSEVVRLISDARIICHEYFTPKAKAA